MTIYEVFSGDVPYLCATKAEAMKEVERELKHMQADKLSNEYVKVIAHRDSPGIGSKNKNIYTGRDPAMGRVSFRTGTLPNRKDKMRRRNSRLARQALKRQLFDY